MMNIQLFKSWFPYILFYFLIFKNPYKYIIPVKEPELIYSQETTWLLDESSKNSDFATVYNKKFESRILDKDNAFPYFKNALSDPSFSSNTRNNLTIIESLGENTKSLNLIKSKNLNQEIMIFFLNLVSIEDILNNPDYKLNQPTAMEIIESINLPENINHFDLPLISNRADSYLISQKSILYTMYLIPYADNPEKTAKALLHCRLLSNDFDSKQLICSILVYNLIVKRNKINAEQLNEIERNLPDWPSLNIIFSQKYRAHVIASTLDGSALIREKLQSHDKDLFLDKNIFLKKINSFSNEIEKHYFNKPIDKLTNEEKLRLTKFRDEVKFDPDKRPLAEIVLFSRSISDKHKWFSDNSANNLLSFYFMFIIPSISKVGKPDSVLQEIKK